MGVEGGGGSVAVACCIIALWLTAQARVLFESWRHCAVARSHCGKRLLQPDLPDVSFPTCCHCVADHHCQFRLGVRLECNSLLADCFRGGKGIHVGACLVLVETTKTHVALGDLNIQET
ncbi:unnamed protein product [Discosporangium mesarthrocarpum]